MADLDQISEDLYGLRPQDFVARRDAEAKAARAAGDRELAAALLALRKPTVSAWLMNLLVRDDAALAPQLFALGEGLRAAESSLDGEQMRALNGQRRQLVAALVGRSRRLAIAAGQRVGDAVVQELDQTLTAALADPEVADEVLSGRLTGPREHVGFGAATASGPRLTVVRDVPARAVRPPSAARPGKAVRPTEAAQPQTDPHEKAQQQERDAAARREREDTARREREEARVRAAAEAARAELDRARTELLAAQERQRAADEVAAEADRTRAQWSDLADTARLDVTRTERELRKLTAALEQVKTRLRDAEQRESRAKDELSGARHEAKAAVVAVRAARDAVTKASRAADRTNRA